MNKLNVAASFTLRTYNIEERRLAK